MIIPLGWLTIRYPIGLTEISSGSTDDKLVWACHTDLSPVIWHRRARQKGDMQLYHPAPLPENFPHLSRVLTQHLPTTHFRSHLLVTVHGPSLLDCLSFVVVQR